MKYLWSVLIVLVGMAFSFSRGIKEGMVMVLDCDVMWIGPYAYLKGHKWFDWYHVISLIPFILFGVLIWMIIKNRQHWVFLSGLLLIIWQFTEMGESYARHLIMIMPYENINILDMYSTLITGWPVYIIHAVRTLAGVFLLMKGFNMKVNRFVFSCFMMVIIAMVIAVVMPSAAEAGIFGKISGVALDKLLGVAVTGIFAILAMVFGASKVKAWRINAKMAKQGLDVGLAIVRATRKDSPGGASITGDEVDNIIKEAGEFGQEVMAGFAK